MSEDSNLDAKKEGKCWARSEWIERNVIEKRRGRLMHRSCNISKIRTVQIAAGREK